MLKKGVIMDMVTAEQARIAEDAGVSAYLFANGLMNGGKSNLYKFNYMPFALSTKPLRLKDSACVGDR